ncbi:MAG: carbohydrate kinase family protein [Alicyclobacillaceae bacterium]|nr:carbohydrate kinase family protein [Alicyclobacillaceae bacterium]
MGADSLRVRDFPEGPVAMVAGHVCLDVIPDLTQNRTGFRDLAPGRLVEVGPAQFATGGAVANTGIALHRLGLPVRLVAKVGTDPFAEQVRQMLWQQLAAPGRSPSGGAGPASDVCLVVDGQAATSYSVVVNPRHADRLLLHYPGTNDTFSAADVAPARWQGIELFHFGYPPLMRRMYEDGGRELSALFQAARAAGAVTSLDMAMPDPERPSGEADWVRLLESVLPYVDLFLPSVEELMYMLARGRWEAIRKRGGPFVRRVAPDDLAAVADAALAMGARIVAVKLGDQGLYLRTQGRSAAEEAGRPHWWVQAWRDGDWAQRELYAPCFRVNEIGTTGAGDCTIAGFLVALVRGLSPEQAVIRALAVGACNVEQADATSGIVPWDEVERRLAAGWKQHPPSPAFRGWARGAGGVRRSPRDSSSGEARGRMRGGNHG